MSAPFPDISTVENATNDPAELFIYANTITNNSFMPLVLFSFFIIVLLGSSFANKRFMGRVRFELSFAVAGFSTVGLAVLMSMKNGLLSPIYVWISIAVAIIGVAWLALTE